MARKQDEKVEREAGPRCMLQSVACQGAGLTYEQQGRAFGKAFTTHATLCDYHVKDVSVGRLVS